MNTIEEAKKNIINNFRANYTNDHQSSSDIEKFLINALDQFQKIVFLETEQPIKNIERDYIKNTVYKILERHANWKPTCCYESDEEKGYQRGLVDEAKLIEKEIKEIL